MKIFFTSSPAFNQTVYTKVLTAVGSDHEVISFSQELPTTQIEHYNSVLQAIKNSDLLLAEISTFTPQTWYDISIALEQKKQVIALYTQSVDPSVLAQVENDAMQDTIFFIQYSEYTLNKQLQDALYYSKKNLMQRFTMLLPYHLVNYLEDISRKKRITKSYFIRSLIEKKMSEGI